MITKLEAPVLGEIEVHKHRIDIFALSESTWEIGLTGGTRASVTLEKHIPKKKMHKIPSFVSIKKGHDSKSG